MSVSTIDKTIIFELFGIKGGYVFSYIQEYNKNVTRDFIRESCGINIYEDEGYKGQSQQRCVEKIFNEESDLKICNLLKAFLRYYDLHTDHHTLDWEEQNRYTQVKSIIERLEKKASMNVNVDVLIVDSALVETLLGEVSRCVSDNNPELALDRLHTATTKILRFLCIRHSLEIVKKDSSDYEPLHSLVGKLTKFYAKENCIESEFAISAIKMSISLFEKFNTIRNKQSAAHVNELLNKDEATYVISIIPSTLRLIARIEDKLQTANAKIF